MSSDRKHVSLGKTSTDVMLGRTDYREWTDEELAAGRKRSRRGTWEGRAPIAVPMELLREIRRRQDSKGAAALASKIHAACEYIAAVAAGEIEGDDVRLRHCVVLLNRVWGMAPQRVEINEGPSQYELAGVTRAIVARPVLDLDSEEVNPDLGPEDDDPFGFNAAEADEPEPERKTERRRRRRDSRKEVSESPEVSPPSGNPLDSRGRPKRENSVWD